MSLSISVSFFRKTVYVALHVPGENLPSNYIQPRGTLKFSHIQPLLETEKSGPVLDKSNQGAGTQIFMAEVLKSWRQKAVSVFPETIGQTGIIFVFSYQQSEKV